MLTIVPFLVKVDQVILNPLLALVFSIAFVYFFWGVFLFVSSEKERDSAKSRIMYGLLGMFIMVSAYGLVRLVLGTFDLPTQTQIINF